MRLRFLALIAPMLLASSGVACGVTWGIQCKPPYYPCLTVPQAVNQAQSLQAGIYRVRVAMPHPIYDGAASSVPANGFDLDPVYMAGNPDTVDCPSYPYEITLVNAASFNASDTITADFLTTPTTIGCKVGNNIWVAELPNQYVNAQDNDGVLNVPNGGLYPALVAGGIPIELTIFNLDSPSDTGEGPILDNDAAFESRLAYMFDTQITGAGLPLPAVVTMGNEEDGGDGIQPCPGLPGPCTHTASHNGDSSDNGPNLDTDMHGYLRKLHDLIAVAHARGMKVGDSGTNQVGNEIAYWDYLWETVGTTASRLQADLYQQGGFERNEHQEDFAAAKLPTSCAPGSPPYLHGSQARRVPRVNALYSDAATSGLDYLNNHAYDVQYQFENAAFRWAQSVAGGIPLMFDEFDVYSVSAYDLAAMTDGLTQLNPVYAVQWGQESSGTTKFARAMVDSNNVIRGNGLWWLAHRGASGLTTSGQMIPPYPNLLTGPAPTLPFSC